MSGLKLKSFSSPILSMFMSTTIRVTWHKTSSPKREHVTCQKIFLNHYLLTLSPENICDHVVSQSCGQVSIQVFQEIEVASFY